ncbi:hypothetical protein SAMN02745244_03300, partial [Tessaracoccus bendigoensis DSM 12906]
ATNRWCPRPSPPPGCSTDERGGPHRSHPARRRYLRKGSSPAIHRRYQPSDVATSDPASIPAIRLVTSDPAPLPAERLVTSGIRLVSSNTAGIGHKSLVSTTITTTRQLDGRARQASQSPSPAPPRAPRRHLRQSINGRFGSRRRPNGSPRRSGCLTKAGFPLRPFVEALTLSGVLGPKPDAERITAIAHATFADGHESFARPSAPSPDKPPSPLSVAAAHQRHRHGGPIMPGTLAHPHSGTSALPERNIHSRSSRIASWRLALSHFTVETCDTRLEFSSFTVCPSSWRAVFRETSFQNAQR